VENNYEGMPAFTAVISHKRSSRVAKTQSLVGEATWYVGEGEGKDYLAAGATRVVESGALCRSRNAALDDGFDASLPVIELSDDMQRLDLAINSKKKQELSFSQAVSMMLRAMDDTGAMLAGVAPTSNAFFFHPEKPLHTAAFIVGDMIAVKPNNLRFEEAMTLKEDYDYTLQHLTQYGAVARVNAILASFVHRSNPGGACDYRTAQLEQENIAFLKRKWGSLIKDNKRRPNEILLNLKGHA